MGMLARARDWASVTIFQPARHMDRLQLGVALASGLWGGLLPIPGITTAVVGLLLAIFSLAVKVQPLTFQPQNPDPTPRTLK